MLNKDLLMLGVSAVSLFWAQGALAQGAAEQEAQPAQQICSGNDCPRDASRDVGSELGSNEIIVTARRRNELLQQVPIAVSAISAQAAAQTGIFGVEALTLVTPNLQFNREISQGGTPFLRGVGSPQASAGGESPVAVYIDDVYIYSPNANMFQFNNIESVQVLKGPQGTLFGRNATGGVIQVRTKRPSFDTEIETRLGYGNYNTVEGGVYATTGLSENLAMNFAASGRHQDDGFGRSLVNGNDIHKSWDWNVRSQLLWQASDRLTFLLSGDYSKQRSDLGSNSTVFPGSRSLSGSTFSGRNTQSLGTDFAEVSQGGISLKVDYETDFANIVSITAYRETKLSFSLDQDLSPAPLVQVGPVVSPTNTFTQELQLVSNSSSSLDWIVGAFFLKANTGYDPSTVGGAFFAPLNSVSLYNTQALTSYSAFGEVTWGMSDKLNLTVGLRYTVDQYMLDVQGRDGNQGGNTFPLPGNTFTQDSEFSRFTYRAILDYAVTSDILAYASYNRGFRSGGYQLSFPGNAANPAPVVQPEVIDSYEVGIKTQFFNGNLTINGAAFYYDYQDLAISFVQPGGNLILNAAGANIKGLELEFIAQPFAGLRINGGIGLLDSEYTDFPNGPLLLPNPSTCTPQPMVLAGPRTGGNRACTGNLTGNASIRAPRFTASIAPSYTFDTTIGAFTVAANYFHNSGFFWDVGNRIKEPSFGVVNGSITWTSRSEHVQLRIWGNNIANEFYGIYAAPNVLVDAYSAAPPRTFGMTAIIKFGG